MPAEERKAIHAYVTISAHDSIHGYADENGVSVSGLLEAIGVGLQTTESFAEPSLTVGVSTSGEVIRAARKIDAARRRRGGS